MMGRPGSGRARNTSMSFPRSATTISPVQRKMMLWDRWLVGATWGIPTFIRSDFGGAPRGPAVTAASGSGNEERGQPGLDVLGDLLGRAILGIVEGALAGEALIGARHVIGHPGEGGYGHDRFVGGDIDQVELRVDAEVLGGRQTRVLVDDQRGAACAEANDQPVGRRHAGGIAVKLERQRVADLDPDPRLGRSVRLV